MSVFRRSSVSAPVKLLENVDDADGLFRKHTVAEIRGKDEQIKHEIEAKKQDLRMMVGERYRDLINAADSITDMKIAAENIRQTLETMEDVTKLEQEKPVKPTDDESEWLYPVTAQIKLLVDTPEQIYYVLEKLQFQTAAQLYTLALHVNQNLIQLNASSKFPVIQKLWDAVKPLKDQIISRCATHQRLLHHTSSSHADACKSRCLLEDFSATQALKVFLETRTMLLNDLLAQAGDQLDGSALRDVLKVFYTTLEQADEIVASLNEQDVISISQLFPGRSVTTVVPHLPSEAPKWLQDKRGQISTFEKQNILSAWTKDTMTLLQQGFAQVLSKVESAKQLWNLRSHASRNMEEEEGIRQGMDWNNVCLTSLGDLASCKPVVESAFVNQAKSIISKQFSSLTSKDLVEKSLESLASVPTYGSVRDLSWLLWKNSKEGISNEFTLDTLVAAVLGQISTLSKQIREDLGCLQDSLSKELKEASITAFKDYSDALSNLLSVAKSEKDEWLMVDKCLLIGRMARGISHHVPELVLFQQVQEKYTRKPTVSSAVQSLQQQFDKVMLDSHGPWIEHVVPIVGQKLLNAWKLVDWTNPAPFKAVWEAVAIKGTDESGTNLEDKQYLPAQLTPAVFQALVAFCQELNRAFAHTIPKASLQSLSNNVAMEIVKRWKDLQSVQISESGALQLLFDAIFLNKLFTSQKLDLTWLRSKVDPIELKLSEAQIVSNVDKFYFRTSVLLGSLTSLNPKAVEGKKSTSLQELHSTLALAPQAPRFSMLAVVGVRKPMRDISLTSMPSRQRKGIARPARTGTLSLTEGGSVSEQKDASSENLIGSLVGEGQKTMARLENTLQGGVSSLLGFLSNPSAVNSSQGRSRSPSPSPAPFFM